MQAAIAQCIEAYNQALAPGDEPMTQARLASALGVTQGAVSRWARGSRPLTINRLAQIAEVLRCDTTDLLFEAVSKTSRHSQDTEDAA